MKIKENIKLVAQLLVVIMVFDMIAFMAWGISGCQPSSGFFLGALTNGLINFLHV